MNTIRYKSCGTIWTGKVKFTSRVNGTLFYFYIPIACDDKKSFICGKGEVFCISEKDVLTKDE